MTMSPISVLYVDDEPSLLEIGKLFLEERGQFIVDTITSAQAAFTLLDTKTYDAIISDYQMPGIDGIEFLKAIRTSGNTIPFILFTGRGREEVVIQALNEGADFYLQKGGEPVSQFTELAHQIRQAIQKRMAEASIRDHERLEADIINFQPDATVAIDRAGHIIAWNHAMEEVTGVSAAEMLGKGDYEYSVPFYGQRQPTLIDLIFESDENIAKKYAHIIHKNDTLIADTIYPTLRGESVTFMAMASPLFNRQGEVIGAIESIRDITERKQAEEALRESEKKYRQIVETTDEGIWKLDEKFDTAYVNRWMADMLGYTPEEMRGRSYTSFMAAEDVPDRTPLVEERREGKRGRYECRFMTKDGRIRWLQVSATPLLDPDGTFRGSFGMCSDITDRKITEEKLRQNYDELAKNQNLLQEREKQYRQIVETTKEGIWQVDENFETVYVNQQMADMFGYPPEEMMGRCLTSFVAEEDLPDQITRLEESRQGKSGRFERRFVTKDGRIRWIQVSATPLLDPDNTFRGSFGMCSDITDRKTAEEEIACRNQELRAAYEQLSAAEEKLRQNYDELAKNQNLLQEREKQYRQIVETTNEGICKLDEKLETVYVNQRMTEMLGNTPEDMMGRSYTSFMAAEDVPDQITRLKERWQGKSGRYERRFVTKDGRIRWLQVSATPIMDPDGTFRGSFAMHSDITDHKEAEEEIARRNEELRAAYEQVSAAEEKLRQNYDELAKNQNLILESEKQYRQIVETTNEGICQLDEKLEMVYINRRMAEMHGCTPEEMMGQNIAHFMVAEEIPVNTSRIKERRLGTSSRYERRFVTKDGRIRWMQVSSTPLFDPDGTFRGSFAMYSDITDHKEAEEEIARRNEELHEANEQLTATEEELRQNYDELAKHQDLLRKSEQRYRNVIEDQTEFICRFLPDGTHVFVNEAYCRYFGLTREEIAGHRFRPKIPVEDQEFMKWFFASLNPDHPVDSIEHRIIMPDGTIRWQRWSDRAIFDHLGTITEYQSVGRDITEIREAQLAREKSEIRFRQQYQNNPLPIVTWQHRQGDFVFIDCNQATETISGRELHKFIGKRASEIFETRPELASEIRRCFSEQTVISKNIVSEHFLPGRHIHVTVAFVPPDLIMVYMDDITEQKKAEKALRNSQRMLAKAMDLANMVTWERDLRTGVLTFDDRFSKLYGTNAESKGIHRMTADVYSRDIVHPEDRGILADEDEKSRNTTDPHYVSKREYRIIRGDGEIRHLEMCAGITKDAQGRTIKTHGVNQDITDLKRAEEAQCQANRKLMLLSGITRHDINNQILTLKGFLVLLHRKVPDPSLEEYFTRVTEASERITSMIQFTKEYENIGVNAPIWQDCRILADTAAKEATLGQVVVKNDLPAVIEVFADPLIVKVFYNLMDNAVRYGGKITTIRFSGEERDDRYFVVCEDDGNGVPADEKEQIFERGFGKNTGMGLFLAREILSITGITITETGEPGKGARFEMIVPQNSFRQ